MVVLYVKGQRVGTLAEAEHQMPGIIARGDDLEFRDEAGGTLRRYVTSPEPICPWEPNLTRDEIDRRCSEPGGTSLAEFWKRMGVE